MTPTRILFDLVKNLSQAEKLHFRAFAKRRFKNGSVSYLRLFELVDQAEEYDEEKIAAAVGVAVFPSLKMRLEELILEALQERRTRLNPMTRIRSMYEYCIIAYEMKLLDLMYRRMDKVQRRCLEMEDYATLRAMMQMKQVIALEGVDPGFIPPVMKGFYDLYPEVKARLHNLEAYGDMEDRILHARSTRPNEMYDLASKLATDPLLADDAPRLSVRGTVKYCEVKRTVLRFMNRHSETNAYSIRIVEALEQAQHLLQDSSLQEYYERHIGNIAVNHVENSEFELAKQAIQRLRKISTSPVAIFDRVHIIELALALQRLDKGEGNRVVASIAEGLKEFGTKVHGERFILLCFHIAHFYLCFSEPSKALKWILRIQQFTVAGIRTDLRHYAEILFLICHFDLGNYELIPGEARKTKLYLKKRDSLSEVEDAVVTGLVRAAKVKGTSARLAKLETMYQKLETLFEDPRHSIKQHYFPILSWIRAKGSKRLPMEVELENRSKSFS
ncbi:MAG: hypothetical protein RLZZ165_2230 [Bacteroidota bacterium]